MNYFDLHCDTMVACEAQDKPLLSNNFHVNIEKAKHLDVYVQCFAVFVADSVPEESAFPFFKRVAQRLIKECEQNHGYLSLCQNQGDLEICKTEKKIGAVLTVENGLALSGELSNITEMAKLGVKMMTLTWNGDNKIGTGAGTSAKTGLTNFGRKALALMEEAGIIADISHASDWLFEDVASFSQKPIVASHSNARKICSHRRNLTDEQFKVICEKNGLVGLNFYRGFLREREDQANVYDILRHAEHFLSLGGEDVLAMGSDFDGAEMPNGVNGLESVEKLYELFLKENYNESLVKKIFFENAESFFKRNNLL